MRSFKFLALFLLFYVVEADNSRRKSSMAAHAINTIIRNYLKENSWKVDLITFGLKSESLVEKVMSFESGSVLFEIRQGIGQLRKIRLNASSVLIFDSVEGFKKVQENIIWQNNNSTRYCHLVYIPNAKISDLEKIQDGFSIDQVNFLMHKNDELLELVTSFMFTENKCKSITFKVINWMKSTTKKWETTDFYPQKYRNFHGCVLNVKVDIPNTKVLMTEISKNVNLKAIIEKNSRVEIRGTEDIQIVLLKNLKTHVRGATIAFSTYLFFVPPGELYTPFEKMFLPFDLETWLAIITTFLIALLAIGVINLCSEKVKNFVFGLNIRTPTMNLLDIFLNGGQLKIPGRNFARFMLMMFIIWSLIIRTAYQSKMFDFLYSDPRRAPALTFDELFERNFTLFSDTRCSMYEELLKEWEIPE